MCIKTAYLYKKNRLYTKIYIEKRGTKHGAKS